MRTRAILAVLLASIGFLAVAPGSARAEKRRVAVLPVEGARNAKLERTLRKMVKADHVLVSKRVYRKAARRLRAKRLNAEHVAEVAAYLEIHGVLEGTLHPVSSGYKLTLRLREGATGRPVKTYIIPVRANRLSERNADKLRGKLRDEIADLQDIGDIAEAKAKRRARAAGGSGRTEIREDAAVEEEDYPEEDYEEEDYEADDGAAADSEPVAEVGSDDVERRPAMDKNLSFDEEQVEDVPDEQEVTVASVGDSGAKDWTQGDLAGDLSGSPAESGRDPYTRVVGINLSAGPSFVARSLQFSSAAAVADQVSEYSPVAAPGAFVSGELYPLALLSQKDRMLNNIGFSFRYEESVFGFQTPVANGDGGQIGLPTARRALSFGLRYRLLLGSSNTSPVLTFGGGLNQRDYVLDKSALEGTGISIDLPDVSYTYFDPRVSFRWPMTNRVAFALSAAYLLVADAGDMTTPETYGTALVTGGDADVHFDVRVTKRVTVSVGAMATGFAYDFNADGELSANRDMDLATEDVAGALDVFMGGYVTAGFVY